MISAQDLSHRLSVVKMPQELSELAHSINFMLHRLDNGIQQLSQFSDDLAHELRSPISNRSEEHTSELQSLMRISYAVFCLKKTNNKQTYHNNKLTYEHKY